MAERVEVYRNDKKEWRWRKVAGNGEIVSISSEGLQHRAYAITRARQDNPGAVIWAPPANRPYATLRPEREGC